MKADAFGESIAVEEIAELLKDTGVAQRLEGEVLVPAHGALALVEPKADHVRGDAPAAFAVGVVEVFPELLNGGAAVAAVPVKMGARALQLDDRQRLGRGASAKLAEDRIGSLPGDRNVLPARPLAGSLRERRVPQRLVEHVAEELALQLRLAHLGKLAAGLKVSPLDQDLMSSRGFVIAQAGLARGLLEKPLEDEPIGLRLAQGVGCVVLEQAGGSHSGLSISET